MHGTKLSGNYRIKIGVFSGFLFSSIITLFDLIGGEPFSVLKFSLNTVVFGTIMGFIIRSKRTKIEE
ncbi:MAG: hypothetical protein HRU49_00055 [Winogradskyella sp.]|uniref:hypothetical protein n=1 Tax=Winogradskyella sp. TaxID=1883156 RepID=UPI0025E2D6AB|nr:hypothetical protein [Winogradskyella sp.]NRB82164.1 hypothetical protein [Winogradskyella sp.]